MDGMVDIVILGNDITHPVDEDRMAVCGMEHIPLRRGFPVYIILQEQRHECRDIGLLVLHSLLHLS